ncbi:phosphotyrosyl phosphatase activator [Dacryopinax primogenitus]|uniref:Serine/threonine-protein phosphatase 2A activator n=1 Tax=Dacryopinax primogenitus (strain DJM 731) TaxID=1858805 RepID=M5GBW7_DACPD|nr:phosphotyrosyl phosphatase activator [Dacryopinax primogenitus]EJU01518.1 phosphotyrosyl phosphatase activator [Dacryopinax primogenitus]
MSEPTTSYQKPTKCILTQEQVKEWETSPTYASVMTFIERLNDAVVGIKLTSECDLSEGVKEIIGVLDDVEQISKDTPPVSNSASRFGNPAFRDFYDKVGRASPELHKKITGIPDDAIPELSVYFSESWGNRTRIDYGSGMELNFLCWLLCLEKLGVLKQADDRAVIIRVFWRYIGVMRTLQQTYWLEPAGSHGVWGLDDYHFLPFVFGSAQLRGHKYLRPKSIHDADVLEMFGKDYMYVACIAFINSIKTASLRWHSPMLDDISSVKTWDKVNSGMFKMYRGEVLGKLPVIQHFYFGSLLPFTGTPISDITFEEGKGMVQHEGHVHVQSTWGDCCGIKIPAVFGAAQAEKVDSERRPVPLNVPGLRPVPFD